MSKETKTDPWMTYSEGWWTREIADVLILSLHRPFTRAGVPRTSGWKAIVENQDCYELHSSLHESREEAERAVMRAAREILMKAMDALTD